MLSNITAVFNCLHPVHLTTSVTLSYILIRSHAILELQLFTSLKIQYLNILVIICFLFSASRNWNSLPNNVPACFIPTSLMYNFNMLALLLFSINFKF